MAGALLGTPGGGGRKSRRQADMPPMAEINVTPFVDVMLVLLIIFMVAAPMMTVSLPVDMPTTSGAKATPADPLTISVDLAGRMFVNDTEVNEQTLGEAVDRFAKDGKEQRIFIRGDKGVVYGKMVGIVGALSLRGYHRIGLVTGVAQQ